MKDFNESRVNLFALRRFMSFVNFPDEATDCWPWEGNKPDGRYGHFCVEGKALKAHRWIYALCCGEIPDDAVIRHKCDNPSCVNPDHLTIGTPRDNVQDREQRGRGADRKGEKHPLARLCEGDVREIRRLGAMGKSTDAISKLFPVSSQQVGKILRRENWGHIQ